MKNEPIKLSGNMIEVKLSNAYIERKANEVLAILQHEFREHYINKEDVTINYISDIAYLILIDRFGTPPSEKAVFEVARIVWWNLAEEEFKKLKEDED